MSSKQYLRKTKTINQKHQAFYWFNCDRLTHLYPLWLPPWSRVSPGAPEQHCRRPLVVFTLR